MNLHELKNRVDGIVVTKLRGHTPLSEFRLCIPIQTTNTVGGTPCVDIKDISAGIDWDQGKIIVWPEKDLRIVDADELKILRKSAEDLGWSVYEFNNLKTENKRLLKKIAELQSQLDGIK